MLTIQILQYEFLGPIKISEWGPPMEKTIYLILRREKDSFIVIYAGDCEKTSEEFFFTVNPQFKCWIEKSGSEKLLYLAILPLFDSIKDQRKRILNKIISQFRPICNLDAPEQTNPYSIRPKPLSEARSDSTHQKITCPCCGSEMKIEKILEKTTLIRCTDCGLSDTRLNS